MSEWLSGCCLALGDLIFVVRKDVIDTAAMDVQRGAEIFHRHGGALNVPTRTPFTERRFPAGFLGVLRRFPEDEISRLLLLVFVGVDPRTDLEFTFVKP